MALGAAATSRRNILTLAVFLFVTYIETVSSTPTKSFRRATNRSRTDLCPSGQTVIPYATIHVDMLDLPSINTACPAPYSLCSWKCTLELNCMAFVWRSNTKLCEFYSSAPQTCTPVSGCIHFEVSSPLNYSYYT